MRKFVRFYSFFLIFLFIILLSPLALGQTSKPINLDFKNADLKDVLRILASQEGANFLIDNEVSGSVTIHLSKVTFEDALGIIAQTNNLVITKDNNLYTITQVDNSVLNVEYQDNLLTLEAQNARLIKVLKAISEKAGVNLVPDPDLKERITLSFSRVSLENGIDTVLFQANCMAEKNGAVTFIRKKPTNQMPFNISYQNDLLTVDAKNVPISILARSITEKTGVSIVPNQDVTSNITIYFQNLPLPDALNILCQSNNLQLIRDGLAWRIARSSSFSQGGQNLQINYDSRNELFDLEIQTASITSVISDMARKANLNLVIMAQVNWTVNNIRLKKLKFTEALDYLLKGTIFTYKLINDTYLIGDGLSIRPENAEFADVKVYPIKYLKADQLLNTLPPVFPRQSFVLMQEKNALIVTAVPAVHQLFEEYLKQIDAENNEDRTELIKIKYLKAEDVLKLIPASIPKTDIIVVKELNSITVTGPQNVINQVKQYIEKVDQVNPMIVFDISIIQVSNSNDLDWTPPSGAIKLNDGKQLSIGLSPKESTFTYDEASGSIKATLTALINKGKAKVLSNPTITTLNGYPTNFSVSTKRVYSIKTATTDSDNKPVQAYTDKSFDSGLYITITPWVAENKITMEIKPKISEYGSIPDNTSVPETFERSTETTIRVDDNQTIVISGLKKSNKSTTISKIPILGDIPLLGYLFKKRKNIDSQEEFVILITPHLVYDGKENSEVTKKIIEPMNTDIKEEVEKEINPEGTTDGKEGKKRKKKE